MSSYRECEIKSQKVHRLLNLFRRCQEIMEKRKKIKLIQNFPYQKIIQRIFSLAFDPQKQFGIDLIRLERFLENKKVRRNLEDADERFLNFLNLLKTCSSSEVINEDLRKQIFHSFRGTTQDERTLMLNLLSKRLNIGVDFYMAQSLFGENFIQLPRDFMRAGYYKTGMALEYPLLVEPCIDGERFKLVVTPEGDCQAYDGSFAYHTELFKQFYPAMINIASRTKKVLEVDLLLYLDNVPGGMLTRLFNRDLTEPQIWKDVKVYVTDTILGDGAEHTYEVRRKRSKKLALQWKVIKDIEVKIMPCQEVVNAKEVRSLLKRTASEKGIILKDPQSGYVRKRDSLWLKLRPETMTRYTARIEELIRQYPDNPNSLCGFVAKAEGGITVLIKQFHSDAQKYKMVEKGLSLIGCAIEFVLDENDNPIFYRLRPHRTVNG